MASTEKPVQTREYRIACPIHCHSPFRPKPRHRRTISKTERPIASSTEREMRAARDLIRRIRVPEGMARQAAGSGRIDLDEGTQDHEQQAEQRRNDHQEHYRSPGTDE